MAVVQGVGALSRCGGMGKRGRAVIQPAGSMRQRSSGSWELRAYAGVDALTGLLESLRLSTTRPMSVHSVSDKPHQAILDIAEQAKADLIVIGNQGMVRYGRFTSAVPARVLRGANCSVLVVDTTAAGVERACTPCRSETRSPARPSPTRNAGVALPDATSTRCS